MLFATRPIISNVSLQIDVVVAGSFAPAYGYCVCVGISTKNSVQLSVNWPTYTVRVHI